MKFNYYIAPYDGELMEMGYIPSYVSRAAQAELHRALTLIGSKYTVQADWFMQFYGNMLEPARTVVGVMAYGMDNIEQFGGDMDRVLFNAIVRVLRRVNWRWIKFSGECKEPYRPKINRKFIDQFTAIIVDAFEKEARDMCRRVAGEQVEYQYERPRRKKRKPTLHKGHGKGGSYRIERYADIFE